MTRTEPGAREGSLEVEVRVWGPLFDGFDGILAFSF
jgi:hypothetical protein